ncbi:MAG: ABC transporter permease [Micrococcales bacterium]|nr:ABC transporter permease [Micrococcales bacterium]
MSELAVLPNDFVSSQRAALRRLSDRHAYASVPVGLCVVLFVVNLLVQPAFAGRADWATASGVLVPYLFIGMAFTLPVLQGGFDLSIGTLAGFMTIFVSTVLLPSGITAPELVIPLVVAFGLLSGTINGFFIVYVRLPPIIATLGMYLFYEGLGTAVLPEQGGTIPGWLVRLSQSYGPIPGQWFVVAGFAIVWLALSRTALFRNILVVGGDERAAYTAGVNVKAVRLSSYALTGAIACIAGLMLAALIQSGDGTIGAQYTISGITAVALGGISLHGGKGGLFGGALGGAVLFLIAQLLTDANVSIYAVQIVDGIILIVALSLNGTLDYLRRRLLRKSLAQSAVSAAVEEGQSGIRTTV